MLVTDAQVHIWEADRPERPWVREGRTKPHRETPYGADELIADMDAAGVDRAVMVPPTWVGENNATALEAAARYPRRLAVMGRFDPHWSDARERLERWMEQPGMLGIRMSLFLPQMRAWLEDGTLDWYWPACERLGIPQMVLAPLHLPKVGEIAERHPGLTLVIDHMGLNPLLHGPEAFDNIQELLNLGRYPNVVVKVTSAPSFSRDPYPFKDIHPFLRQIYDAFGAKRMLWGTDITRLRGTYSECLALFREALDFLIPEDKDWVLGRAAAVALNWPEDF